MSLKFRVELVWQGDQGDDEAGAEPVSLYLTADGRVILKGRHVTNEERAALDLPTDGDLISVDRRLVRAIKEML